MKAVSWNLQEWSPIHNLKSLKKKLASVEEKEQAEPTNLAASAPGGELGESLNILLYVAIGVLWTGCNTGTCYRERRWSW
jgi:hypothetical protein